MELVGSIRKNIPELNALMVIDNEGSLFVCVMVPTQNDLPKMMDLLNLVLAQPQQ